MYNKEFEALLEEAFMIGYEDAYNEAKRICDVEEDPRFARLVAKGNTREARRKSIIAQRKAIIAADRKKQEDKEREEKLRPLLNMKSKAKGMLYKLIDGAKQTARRNFEY